MGFETIEPRTWRVAPRLHSIQARYTLTATALLLMVLTAVGVSVDLSVRDRMEDDIFFDAQRVAGRVGAEVRSGTAPHPLRGAPGVSLVQLVDVHGRVVDASPTAAGRPPLSTLRPPPGDRLQKRIECSAQGKCVLLMADRVTPAADAPIVYAGVPEPSLLAAHRLEYLLAASVLGLTALTGWLIWCVIGRTLRPVAAIRTRMSEITANDLSRRVPVPAGEDEIVLLARTANQTLARLEGAVEQQRRFASTTSHELRTPIAGLRVRLEEALLYPDEVDRRDTIECALSVAGRLEAIVNDLLVHARLRAADPAPPELIDLGTLAREEAVRGDGVPVRVHAADGVRVRGSRIQLIRVLGNLLSNARRHADAEVEIFVDSTGDGEAVVAVVDDGAGVVPADRERIFERFIRLPDGLRRDSGGSGLGLAISRDIAHAHQGTLGVEDSPRGARFVLRLPLADHR